MDGYTLVVWKQLDKFVDRKFSWITSQNKNHASWTWRAERKNFAFGILMEAWHYDAACEMNCSEKEHSLI